MKSDWKIMLGGNYYCYFGCLSGISYCIVVVLGKYFFDSDGIWVGVVMLFF